MDNLKVTYFETSKLIPDPENVRQHDKRNIDAIKQSIQRFGIRKPVVAHEDSNIVYAGNGVLLAALELEIESIPVAWIPTGTPVEVAKAYSIYDNRTTELSSFDPELLNSLIDELDDFDLDELLWTPIELDELLQDIRSDNEQKDEDFDIDKAMEYESELISKTGDIWLCGKHRVMVGDSTESKNMEQLMNGVKADIVFTDPPYGINVVGKDGNIGGDTKQAPTTKFHKVVGDDKEFNPLFCLDLAERCFLWGGNYFAHLLPKGGRWFVWDKNRPKGLTLSDCELAWSNIDGVKVQKFKVTWDGYHREGESGKRIHPTQKPIKLIVDILMELECKIILDPFLGSGTTLIAAEKTNRICYGMEISSQYCDVICKRYYEFTGDIPIRESDNFEFPVE